jgi:hypothetical protein
VTWVFSWFESARSANASRFRRADDGPGVVNSLVENIAPLGQASVVAIAGSAA